MKQPSRSRGVFLVTLFFALALPALAQTAQVTGRVTDQAGAVVPDTKVTVTNVGNGFKREAVTNDDGFFTVPLLQPGQYQITLQKSGFKPLVQSGVVLQVEQVARLDYTLETGAVSETVNIAAAATAALETETSSLGKVVDQQRIQNLPLLGRNPYSLVALVPGARPSAGLNDLPVDQISQSFVSINGARGNQNEYLLDGAPNTAAAQNQPVVFVNPDAVQEFKVETNNFSAQYGRAGGGVFNIVTRSGTNEFHGTAYDYLRNDVLNANTFFGNRAGLKRPPFRYNQFGATIGGPIDFPERVFGPAKYDGKNRSFFFGSYEGVRFSQGGTYVGTVPTLQQRAGDFSQTRNAAGNVIPIFDPATTRANPAGGFLRDPFPGNVIPRNRFNPVFAKMLDFIPLPNATGNANTAVGNFVTSSANRISKDTFSVRLDHQLNERQRLSGRFNYDNTPISRPNYYGNIASPTFGGQVFKRRNFGLDYNVTFTPTLVGSFLFSFTRLENNRRPFSSGFDITTLGLPAALKPQLIPESFPTITVAGMGGSFSVPNAGTANLLGGSDLISFGDNTASWVGSLTKTLSRHTLKFGGETRLLRPNYWQFGDTAINFSFAQNFTQGPNPTAAAAANTGFGFASFMLGIGAGSYSRAASMAMQVKYYGGYLQDDWKLTNKLTLNLGLRYEYESPRTERYNQLTNFDFNATPPLTAAGLNLKGALSFVGVNGNAREQWNPDRNNVAPRFGFAWNVAPKTVIRGGGGLFYAAMTGVGGASGAFGVSGFEAATAMVTSLNGVTPLNFLDNPYPTGINQPTGSRLGPATLLGQAIRFTDRNLRQSYSAQWNLNLQRELPGGLLAEVGYAGNRGLKLQQDRELNQLPDSALALGDTLRQTVPNPFAGQITTGALAAANITRAQLLRPFPHYLSVVSVNAAFASSNYHAMVASLQRRFSKGLTLTGSYTFSKLIDLTTGGFAGETLSNAGFQNTNNLRADRSLSALDAPHRLVVNGLYALPFGPGHKLNPTGAAGAVLNGWEMSAIYTYQSGGPLAFSSATNTTFAQGGGQRPNLVGNPVLADGERTLTRWFNTAAFAAPAAYTFGSAPRSLGSVRSDGLAGVDFSVVKNTTLHESLRLQFRAEFFNLTNTVRFAPPNTAFGSAAFGQVNAQSNQPRVVQFALKLIY
ncbi:MAG: carboxypeptidase regulatory-like domain-containing protein [Blastocatellia bacterium]|nr:carboxypeptidase regulatory-like domain-containing protein [Blastocatellia bacterium]